MIPTFKVIAINQIIIFSQKCIAGIFVPLGCANLLIKKLFLVADANITPVDIQKMMEAGMNVARFKMSHTTRGEKQKILGKVDKAALALSKKHGLTDWPIATCVDLKTCIVKTGLLKEVSIPTEATKGQTANYSYNKHSAHEQTFCSRTYMCSASHSYSLFLSTVTDIVFVINLRLYFFREPFNGLELLFAKLSRKEVSF